MKLKNFAIAAFSLVLSSQMVLGQDGKSTLAVSSVTPTPSLKAAMASAGKGVSLGRVTEAFDSQLISAVNATRKFDIVGRSDLKDIMKEQELGNSGNVDAKTAAQQGKLTGCQLAFSVLRSDKEFNNGNPALANGLIIFDIAGRLAIRLGVANDAAFERFVPPARAPQPPHAARDPGTGSMPADCSVCVCGGPPASSRSRCCA